MTYYYKCLFDKIGHEYVYWKTDLKVSECEEYIAYEWNGSEWIFEIEDAVAIDTLIKKGKVKIGMWKLVLITQEECEWGIIK